MLTLGATANHVIALQYLCMFNESNVFILFHFLWGCYGGALVFLGGAGAPASPSLALPMNEEMASQNHHLHLCHTDTENTSLLVNNSNISLLFPPDTFKLYCVYLKQNSSATDGTLLLRDSKHRRAALDSRDTVACCFHQRCWFHH